MSMSTASPMDEAITSRWSNRSKAHCRMSCGVAPSSSSPARAARRGRLETSIDVCPRAGRHDDGSGQREPKGALRATDRAGHELQVYMQSGYESDGPGHSADSNPRVNCGYSRGGPAFRGARTKRPLVEVMPRSCHNWRMATTTPRMSRLTGRLHVDLQRVSSAVCCAVS